MTLGYILGKGPPGSVGTAHILGFRHDRLVGGDMLGYKDIYALLSAMISGEHPLADLAKQSKTDLFILPAYHKYLVGRLLLRNEPSDIAIYVVEVSEEVNLWGYYHPTDN